MIDRLKKTEPWKQKFQKFEKIQKIKKIAKLKEMSKDDQAEKLKPLKSTIKKMSKHHAIETIKLRMALTPKTKIETKFDHKTYSRRVNRMFNLMFG